MKTKRLATAIRLASLGWLVLWSPARADLPKAETIFKGVQYIHDTVTAPRPLDMYIVLIDPKAQGIHFQVTEPYGDPADGLTNLETTKDYVSRVGVQVGINANFYGIVNQGGLPFAKVDSLAASLGTPYSPFQGNNTGVNFAADNTITFVRPDPSQPGTFATDPPVSLYNAVSGNFRILDGGVNVAPTSNELAARSVLGLTGSGELVLLVVDGGNAGVSEGMTFSETAQFLSTELNVIDAINLDGGGSSSLVAARPDAFLLNNPMGLGVTPGEGRPVGNSLAIFADPVPEPASLILLGLGLVSIAASRSRQKS